MTLVIATNTDLLTNDGVAPAQSTSPSIAYDATIVDIIVRHSILTFTRTHTFLHPSPVLEPPSSQSHVLGWDGPLLPEGQHP